MFRMLQALEREPQEDITQLYDVSPAPGRLPFTENGDHRNVKRDNPHKYLLYKPTFSQFFVFLSSGFKELPANGVLLLYLSADGCFLNNKHPDDSKIYIFFTTSLYLIYSSLMCFTSTFITQFHFLYSLTRL